jgi:hypothetical protein
LYEAFQLVIVVVAVTEEWGATQQDAIDDAGVHQLVGE